MSNVLIATLGSGEPGAVTTSLDVLLERQRKTDPSWRVDKLVVLMTPGCPERPSAGGDDHTPQDASTLVCSDPARLRSDYQVVRQDLENNCGYWDGFAPAPAVEPCVLNVRYDDLYQEAEAVDFLRLCLKLMLEHGDKADVYVAYTGGRKTMSALAMAAAAMTGNWQRCYQAAASKLGNPRGERVGSSEWNARMHPPEGQRWYIGAYLPLMAEAADTARALKIVAWDSQVANEFSAGGVTTVLLPRGPVG